MKDIDEEGAQNPGSNLFVTGIHPRLTESDVSRLFEKYGEVENCSIMLDPHTKESRGFGFVKMVTSDQAEAAKEGLQGEVIEGRTLSIEKARRARPRSPTPGKYFGPPKRGTSPIEFVKSILTSKKEEHSDVAHREVVATVSASTTDAEATHHVVTTIVVVLAMTTMSVAAAAMAMITSVVAMVVVVAAAADVIETTAMVAAISIATKADVATIPTADVAAVAAAVLAANDVATMTAVTIVVTLLLHVKKLLPVSMLVVESTTVKTATPAGKQTAKGCLEHVFLPLWRFRHSKRLASISLHVFPQFPIQAMATKARCYFETQGNCGSNCGAAGLRFMAQATARKTAQIPN
jgi:hypothetical protein